MVEVTIEITQFCEYECPQCSTNASPNGQHLPLEKIREFLENRESIERINISGGEPLSHPKIYEILKICYSITENVWIYTNMIRNLIYNSDIIKEVNLHANVCVTPGQEIYIPKTAHHVHLLKLIHQGRAKNKPNVNVSVSRNFWGEIACDDCNHILLQANGQIVEGPCKKSYL